MIYNRFKTLLSQSRASGSIAGHGMGRPGFNSTGITLTAKSWANDSLCHRVGVRIKVWPGERWDHTHTHAMMSLKEGQNQRLFSVFQLP